MAIFPSLLFSILIVHVLSDVTNTSTDEIAKECLLNDKTSCPIKSQFETGRCSECEAIDPVFDPAYNMKEIAKQSILLEEHLIQRSKRCRDCITKHFLHIIGLAEEAANLCSSKVSEYPLLKESIQMYNSLFKEWLAEYKKGGIENDPSFCGIAGKLRKHRKSLIEVYFYSDKFN